ncbi:fructose-bisphosphatase class III [Oribacterium sp. FC2011]|uniref:fructose-bisphosphatase class III n=1 Tax=Oribacterium sp. FC2011 TaxID=1408311 RepID=UPI0004E12606
MMRDLDYLKLLAKQFPTATAAGAEIINLRAICALPKGTEYFFSDLHGESEAFIYLMRSASGIVRDKIDETFGNLLPEEEQLELANLIYYPRDILSSPKHKEKETPEWNRITINRLINICRVVSSKFTRSKVRKKMPQSYAYAIDELLHIDNHDEDKKDYLREIMNAIIDTGMGDDFIIALCELIQNLVIDNLHIIGDVFDRGPHADRIMEELMSFHDVDIQWGNHDADWMGAVCGNPACIANVLRIATSYNSFDVLEDGYGINLRPLSMYAEEVYGDDPCECFQPHLLDSNVSDSVSPALAAKMCKAISIIMLKEEGLLIKRHPEYHLEHRLLLEKVDYAKGTVNIDGKVYPLKDKNFPTIDPKNPYKLTEREETLMKTLIYSFTHSQLLQKHIRFFFTNGSMYKVVNNNILYHGCIPMEKDGSFTKIKTPDGTFSGKALLDYFNDKAIDAYFLNGENDPQGKLYATDFFWYMWCGPNSPLFGKDKITTFEHCFIEDPATHKERFNVYYDFAKEEKYVDKIFEEFGVDASVGHIVNGHVPVKTKLGESPIKANGKLFIIDGGISKAYHSRTGIAGYTLIFNSRHLALAKHKGFQKGAENTPEIQIVEQMKTRVRVGATDNGRELKRQISDLEELLAAYRNGDILEQGEVIPRRH